MIRHYIELGPVPCDEQCQQVGTTGYDAAAANKECRRYKAQLKRMFPEGVFAIRSFPHDAGSYSEVVVYYSSDDEKSMQLASAIEANLPDKWDDEVKETITFWWDPNQLEDYPALVTLIREFISSLQAAGMQDVRSEHLENSLTNRSDDENHAS